MTVNQFFRAVLCAALLLLTSTANRTANHSATAAEPSDEAGFTPLFDGKTLDGWEGDAKVFRVEDGAIVAGSLKEKIEHNAFLCTTREYKNFELRFDAKLVGQGDNAGVQFRSQRVPNHFEVSGYQCDIGLANGKSIWGALYDESRRNKFLVTGPDDALQIAVNKEGWNHLVVRCEGPRIQIWVNEVATVDYTETDESIAQSGIIGVQIHGGAPAEASYRKLRIKTLAD